jgi:hypothetical protein
MEEPCDVATNDAITTTTNSAGDFEFSLEADSYQCLRVVREKHLTMQRSAPPIPGDLRPLTLLNGDVTGDDRIDIFDLAYIANRYNKNDPTADLNGDNMVDIFDLSIAAGNYNQHGPLDIR